MARIRNERWSSSRLGPGVMLAVCATVPGCPWRQASKQRPQRSAPGYRSRSRSGTRRAAVARARRRLRVRSSRSLSARTRRDARSGPLLVCSLRPSAVVFYVVVREASPKLRRRSIASPLVTAAVAVLSAVVALPWQARRLGGRRYGVGRGARALACLDFGRTTRAAGGAVAFRLVAFAPGPRARVRNLSKPCAASPPAPFGSSPPRLTADPSCLLGVRAVLSAAPPRAGKRRRVIVAARQVKVPTRRARDVPTALSHGWSGTQAMPSSLFSFGISCAPRWGLHPPFGRRRRRARYPVAARAARRARTRSARRRRRPVRGTRLAHRACALRGAGLGRARRRRTASAGVAIQTIVRTIAPHACPSGSGELLRWSLSLALVRPVDAATTTLTRRQRGRRCSMGRRGLGWPRTAHDRLAHVPATLRARRARRGLGEHSATISSSSPRLRRWLARPAGSGQRRTSFRCGAIWNS